MIVKHFLRLDNVSVENVDMCLYKFVLYVLMSWISIFVQNGLTDCTLITANILLVFLISNQKST